MNHFLYLFDDEEGIVDHLEKSDRITSFYPDVSLAGHSKNQDWMELVGIFSPIKFVLFRLVYCYVVTQSDELFVYKNGIWRELSLPFKGGCEEIVQISATYCHVVLLMQNKLSYKTRVLMCAMDSATNIYSAQSKIHKGIEIPQDGLRFESSTSVVSNQESKDWYELLDFVNLLEGEEVVNHISCASSTIICLTSKGRIFSGGSNRFGEAASLKTFGNNTNLVLCEFDETNPTKDPFFVKAVHGDHSIIALTKDGKVFYCGCNFADNNGHLPILKEFSRNLLLSGEYFIDIAATYYGTALLTSKC